MEIKLEDVTVPITLDDMTPEKLDRLNAGLCLMGHAKQHCDTSLEGMAALVVALFMIAVVYRSPRQTDEMLIKAMHNVIDQAAKELLPAIGVIAAAIDQGKAQMEARDATTH